ncbi:hypothetical protein [Amycolatopsis solani]|uniref:hypothetical protein n=1 Tax=Amycolatopsis solani TaxID=3028615 RepID=UPI00296FBB53|nr:hypothetical protein [Amycolatopsis sp. MEP2-6]
MATAAILLVTAAALTVALTLDPGQVLGQPRWAKPLKFAISFALYLGTIGLLVPLVRGRRAQRVTRWAAIALTAAVVVEMCGITGQAARGRLSHFNVSTPVDRVVYAALGAGSVVIWTATAALAVVLLRQRTLTTSLSRGLSLGVLVSLLGISAAFFMVVPSAAVGTGAADPGMRLVGGHAVGVPDGGPGLPLLGWSTTGGDLRIGHFWGLHALQALPLLAFALRALSARVVFLRPERVRARLVALAAAAWTAVTVLLVWQALRGQPLLKPDEVTLLAGAGIVVLTIAGAWIAVRGSHPATGGKRTGARWTFRLAWRGGQSPARRRGPAGGLRLEPARTQAPGRRPGRGRAGVRRGPVGGPRRAAGAGQPAAARRGAS